VAADVRVGNFIGAGNPQAVKTTMKVAVGLIGYYISRPVEN